MPCARVWDTRYALGVLCLSFVRTLTCSCFPDLRHQNLARASPPASPSSRKASSPSPPPSIDEVTNRFPITPLRHAQHDPLTPPRTISPVTENLETEPQSDPVEPAAPISDSDPTKADLDESGPASPPSGSAPGSPPPLPARSSAAPNRLSRNLSHKSTYSIEYRSSKPGTPSRFPAPLSPSAIKRGSTGFAALRAGPPSPTRRTGFGADGVGIGESPLTPVATGGQLSSTPMRAIASTPTGGTMRSSASSPTRPLSQTPTGLGIRPMFTGGGASPVRPMFTGGGAGSPNVFGGRIECPRCAKAVYHAEQVRSWHPLSLLVLLTFYS
jgi:hypothetical protein